ncbi:RNA polymerase subunit sigma-70 [Actinomycetes bacterium KLBMP 9759]
MTHREPTAELLDRARAGDEQAFVALTEPFRSELQAHCYRFMGSTHDAEDLLQETMLAAWRSLAEFEGRSSLRTWLHRIATNRCLNALRATASRPLPTPRRPLPPPTRTGEPNWAEPYPDVLLGLADPAPGPEARYEARESISLAFVAALQHLPPRQRAVLMLRDVLGLSAAETATTLETTEHAVHSALRRARAAVPLPGTSGTVLPDSELERELVDRFVEAFESGDVARVAATLTEDVWLTMPPLPFEYQGAAAADFLAEVCFVDGTCRYRLVPTRANGQPAFGCYVRDPHAALDRAHGLIVLTLRTDGVSALTRFLDNALLPRFGLPRTLRATVGPDDVVRSS